MYESEGESIPKSGSLVNARVISINPRSCKVLIIGVEDTYLKHTFRGIVRKEDIRAFQKDQVEIHKCYRSGDIIRARVLSLGEALHYVLTTAENELGVIFELGKEKIRASFSVMLRDCMILWNNICPSDTILSTVNILHY